MVAMQILTETDLRGLVKLDRAVVDCIENAFVALATKPVVMPPILRLDMAEVNGEVDVKTAYVPGLDGFAVKISPGFFDNPKLGLPSLNGLMVLFSAKTGLVESVLLDNGYLTDIRTAAAGAVAARHLSRENSTTAAILGGGAQARLQLEALTLVRPIVRARFWARRPEQAAEAAAETVKRLAIDAVPVPSVEAAVKDADIVVTTTPATNPILMRDWLAPGQHVTAMGSDAGHKNELDPAIVAAADRYVCDRVSQCAVLGELHHAISAGLTTAESDWPELGAVAAGLVPGRPDAAAITVADLTGTGVQDTAIATLANARAAAARIGTAFESR
jgi:ornithine cyclodeaminase